MAAGVTPIEMAPERGGATARDRPEDRSLLHAQPRMLLEEGVTLRVEDIGHLHGGPAHDCGVSAAVATAARAAASRATAQAEWARRAGVVARVEIHRRVRQVGVAEQQLNRAQIGRFQQMRRVRSAAACAGDALVDQPSVRPSARPPRSPSS